MRRHTSASFALSLAVALLSSVLLVGCGSAEPEDGGAPQGQTTVAPEEQGSPAAQLVEQKCSMCHNTARVYDADYDKAGWTATVERMEQNGLVVTPDEKASIIDYLAEQDAQ